MLNPLTPEQATLRAQLGNDVRWSGLHRDQRTAATQAAHDALWRKYLDQVDPDRSLPEAEREALARQARRADMRRAALKASRNRTAKAQQGREARAVAGYPCPVCGRPAGTRCGAPGTLRGRPMTHPHTGRVDLVTGSQGTQ